MDQEAKGSSPGQLVRDFLRGQNLEQVGKTDEAVALYEAIVAAAFDASGPYDRLIWIYQSRRMLSDVIRIAEASLAAVRTYPEKLDWYRRQIDEARKALGASPEPRPR